MIKKQLQKNNKSLFSFILILTMATTFVLGANAIPTKSLNEIAKNLNDKELDYTFNVSDKLSGVGEIKLTLENNKITGKANGLGMTCQCKVDFSTIIEGSVNKSGNIEVSVIGIGDPLGILLPGKIKFSGPLKGKVADGKLFLTGVVKIEGKLAKYAGFKEKEALSIEIPDLALVKAIKEIQRQEGLASL